jgi:hypothetical protein
MLSIVYKFLFSYDTEALNKILPHCDNLSFENNFNNDRESHKKVCYGVQQLYIIGKRKCHNKYIIYVM